MRPEKPEVKKSYGKPELVVYGHLLQITQAVGSMTVTDGATRGQSKTA